MPAIKGPAPFKTGDEVHGVVCHSCQKAQALWTLIEDLTDPFHLDCSCGHTGTYRLDEIQTLEVHRKQ